MSAAFLKRLEIENRICLSEAQKPIPSVVCAPLTATPVLLREVRSGGGSSVASKSICVTISAAGVPFG